MGVDQIPKFATDWLAGARFSAILTERHLQLVSVNCVRDWSFRAFHRFTAIITTTSFIVFKIFKIFRCDDCGCELLLFHFIGDCEGRSCVSHLFPQRWDIRRTLYFAKKRVQYGSGVIERKTTIPILSNLLVEAKGSQLTITATDLELSIRTSCEAKIKKEGAGTIPAKKLLELVRLLPEGEIKVKLLENH